MRPQKKHWIMVKRGLSADPKHREAMGQAVWCFLHILDRADFETGKVYDWRDADEAEDMGVNERTLRAWRQSLEKAGYIKCQQKQRGLEITIWNWINPRDYSAGIINPKGDIKTAPSEIQGDIKTAPSEFQGDMQGDMQGDIRVRRNIVTPTLDSRVINQGSTQGDETLAWLSKKYTATFGPIPSITIADQIKDAAESPLSWLEFAFGQLAEAKKSKPIMNGWSYVLAVLKSCRNLGGIPTPANQAGNKTTAGKVAEIHAALESL